MLSSARCISATLISYQGRLADSAGNPLTGDYQMQFALYGVPVGPVSVSEGLFNVLLGSVTAIDPACLTGDVYPCSERSVAIGITVGSDSEMTPRELLASVPHAVHARDADKLDGKDSVDFANTSHNHDDQYYTEGKSDSRFLNAGGDTMSGHLSMNGNQINAVTRVSSPGDADLAIDAGAGTNRTLTLQDDVRIPDGDLDMGGNSIYNTTHVSSPDSADLVISLYHDVRIPDGNLDMYDHEINNVSKLSSSGDSGLVIDATRITSPGDSGLVIDAGYGTRRNIHDGDLIVSGGRKIYTTWLGSPGGSDLSLDAGFGSANKIRLDIERVNEIWVQNAYCGALVESNLQTEEELASERIDRFDEGDLQCWSPATQRLEKCTVANDPLVQSVADLEGRPIVIGAELVHVIGQVQPGDMPWLTTTRCQAR